MVSGLRPRKRNPKNSFEFFPGENQAINAERETCSHPFTGAKRRPDDNRSFIHLFGFRGDVRKRPVKNKGAIQIDPEVGCAVVLRDNPATPNANKNNERVNAI
jgi:hypothetical protein